MDLVINFTQSQQFQLSQLQSMQDINEITFIVPIFIFFQNNFKLLYNYLSFLAHRPLIKTLVEPVATEDEIKQLEQYSTVLVRGTFDHLHLGHQVLLLKAIYSTSHTLIVEVKDDSILNNKRLKELLQPVDVRKENVRQFLQGLKPQVQVKIQVITEVYGSAPYTKGIDAVAITEESLHSLNHINKLRKSSNGLKKVQMILSPLLTPILDPSLTAKQQRIDFKLSSLRIRNFLLIKNNMTLTEYMEYRSIWDSLVNEINSLCRLKDIDFMVAEKWWERVLYKHSGKAHLSSKKLIKNNREIYLQISKQNNKSTPNQHSLNQIATNLALLFDGIQQEEKNLNAVVRNFLDGLLKKKGKTKTCKKIRKMIMNEIKEFVARTYPKKMELRKIVGQNQSGAAVNTIDQMQSSKTFHIERLVNVTESDIFQNISTEEQPELIESDVIKNDSQQF